MRIACLIGRIGVMKLGLLLSSLEVFVNSAAGAYPYFLVSFMVGHDFFGLIFRNAMEGFVEQMITIWWIRFYSIVV